MKKLTIQSKEILFLLWYLAKHIEENAVWDEERGKYFCEPGLLCIEKKEMKWLKKLRDKL